MKLIVVDLLYTVLIIRQIIVYCTTLTLMNQFSSIQFRLAFY